MFSSRSEAYLFVIFQLLRFTKQLPHADLLRCIEEIKISFENHEQDHTVIINKLEALRDPQREEPIPFSEAQQHELTELIMQLRLSTYQQTPEEKFEALLARRFETALGCELIQNSTTQMREAARRISEAVLAVLRDYINANDDTYGYAMEEFLTHLEESTNTITYGAFQQGPVTLQQAIDLLEAEHAEHLIEILHLHYKFAFDLMRVLPINTAPIRMPQGELLNIVTAFKNGKYQHHPENFFRFARRHGKTHADYIPDQVFYQSPYYRTYSRRGRAGPLPQISTHQSGLLMQSQENFAEGLPTHDFQWVADAYPPQPPNLKAPHVRRLINNDAVYVAGPSGMTSLFMGLLENLGNFEDVKLKSNYALCCLAYLTSGGFHSFDEVIGPIRYILGLFPEYEAVIPEADGQAPPPNYHSIFQDMADPELDLCLERAWTHMMEFFEHVYLPQKARGELEAAIFTATTDALMALQAAAPRGQATGIQRERHQPELTKVSVLNTHCIAQTIPTMLAYLQHYCNNTLADTMGNVFGKSTHRVNSFMAYFLNEIKMQPLLIAHLNQILGNQLPLLSCEIDYNTKETQAVREQYVAFFGGLELEAEVVAVALPADAAPPPAQAAAPLAEAAPQPAQTIVVVRESSKSATPSP